MSTATLPDDPQLRERFSELKPPLAAQAAVIEANRCLNCFDAPCTGGLPDAYRRAGLYQAHCVGQFARLGDCAFWTRTFLARAARAFARWTCCARVRA